MLCLELDLYGMFLNRVCTMLRLICLCHIKGQEYDILKNLIIFKHDLVFYT